MPQSLASLHVHLVFSTKQRVPLLAPELKVRVFDYLGGVVQEYKGRVVVAGGMPDHVHLLVSMPRDVSVSDMVRAIKSNSSRWIHETYLDMSHFAWQSGYGAFAVSYSNLEQLKLYLANQEQHHRNRTFQDEYRALLRRHFIEFDERYVWD